MRKSIRVVALCLSFLLIVSAIPIGALAWFDHWTEKNETSALGHEHQGAGVAVAQIGWTGAQDAIFMSVDNPDGQNRIKWEVGRDMDYYGQFDQFDRGPDIPVGHENQGGGVSIGDIDGEGDLKDALFMVVDNPEGDNSFQWHIAKDIDIFGNINDPTIVTGSHCCIGHESQGAGVALGDIDREGDQLDALFLVIDNPDFGNSMFWWVARDLNPTTGVFDGGWSDMNSKPVNDWETQGAGVSLAMINDDNMLDALFFVQDNSHGANTVKWWTAYGLFANDGHFIAWSDVRTKNQEGWENQGAGVSFGDIDGRGTPDALFMIVDNPGGENEFWWWVAHNHYKYVHVEEASLNGEWPSANARNMVKSTYRSIGVQKVFHADDSGTNPCPRHVTRGDTDLDDLFSAYDNFFIDEYSPGTLVGSINVLYLDYLSDDGTCNDGHINRNALGYAQVLAGSGLDQVGIVIWAQSITDIWNQIPQNYIINGQPFGNRPPLDWFIAETYAHELGHAYGVGHDLDPQDTFNVMLPAVAVPVRDQFGQVGQVWDDLGRAVHTFDPVVGPNGNGPEFTSASIGIPDPYNILGIHTDDVPHVDHLLTSAPISVKNRDAFGLYPGVDRGQTRWMSAIYSLNGIYGNPKISFQVYDVDHSNEIEIFINSHRIGYTGTTGDNSWSGTRSLTLQDNQVSDEYENLLYFSNSYNPGSGEEWGVRSFNIGPVIYLPPELDQVLNEDEHVENAFDLDDYSKEVEGDSLSYSITDVTNPNCGVTIDSGNRIDIHPTPDWHGTCTVTVEVNDGALTDEDSFVVTVLSVNDPPVADADGPYSVDEGTEVVLDGSGSYDDGIIIDYEWDFGDGSQGNGEFAPHIYGDDGNYNVELTVTDDGLLTDDDQSTVVVNNVAPTATLDPTYEGWEGWPIMFSSYACDPGSDDITLSWNWGDGTTPLETTYFNDGVGPDPPQSPLGTYPFCVQDSHQHTYGDNGDYQITLTVWDDDGGTAVYYATAEIENVAPISELYPWWSTNEGSDTMLSAMACDLGTDDITFTWEWGDGTPPTVNTYYNDGVGPDPPQSPGGTRPFCITDYPMHAYGDNGHYWITLTVSDDDGGSSVYSETIWVNNRNPMMNSIIVYVNGEFVVLETEDWIHFYGEYVAGPFGNLVDCTVNFTDPGSDDLIFTWDWINGWPPEVHTYYNDGIGPDPPESPWGIFPFTAVDNNNNEYLGMMVAINFVITVSDDDGGSRTIYVTLLEAPP